MKQLERAWVERGPESTGKLDEATWFVGISYCGVGEKRTIRLDFVVGGEERFSQFAVHIPEEEFRVVMDVIVGLNPERASTRTIKATEMARLVGICPKTYRRALRDEKFSWHVRRAPWTVKVGSSEFKDMLRVLGEMVRR